MATFTQYTIANAPDASRPLLEQVDKALGFVPNLYATFAESPALLQGALGLDAGLDKGALSGVERQLVKIAVSTENGCTYCVAAHSTIAGMLKARPEIVNAVRTGVPVSDAKIDALVRFTRAVVRNKGFVQDGETAAFLAAALTRPPSEPGDGRRAPSGRASVARSWRRARRGRGGRRRGPPRACGRPRTVRCTPPARRDRRGNPGPGRRWAAPAAQHRDRCRPRAGRARLGGRAVEDRRRGHWRAGPAAALHHDHVRSRYARAGHRRAAPHQPGVRRARGAELLRGAPWRNHGRRSRGAHQLM